MGIEKVLTTATRYGKHKIPRFIYHMTNKANYESMLKDGVIKTTKEGLFGEGIFTTELTNLFKRWRNHKSWGNDSLQEALIEQVAKGSDEIVILRIPTERLNHDLLKVRSQNTYFSWINSSKGSNILDNVVNEIKKMPKEGKGWMDKFINILKKHLSKNNKDIASHLTEGISAKDSHLFKQRKEAIEYIYQEKIPIAKTEKIGEVNIRELRKSVEYDPVRPIRSIFTSLLKGTPEIKGAELLNC